MYVDELSDATVTVTYIPAHTGHELSTQENKFLPLPQSVREVVSVQLSQGIPAKRILESKTTILH